MKLSPAEQESLVQLLTRMYVDICAIETQFRLMAGEGDYRPRIEYFHDAVRAFTSGQLDSPRLCVEMLAYDLSCLRFLAAMPLAPFKPHSAHNLEALSPHTDMVEVKPASLNVKAKKPGRETAGRLSDLYKSYGVIFAALFKPTADRDHRDRIEEMDREVEEINTDTKQPKEQRAEKISKKDKEIASVDAAHMNYAMAQLGIYEESKDMLKQMAGQGMNIVGKFVESSIREARRQMGR